MTILSRRQHGLHGNQENVCVEGLVEGGVRAESQRNREEITYTALDRTAPATWVRMT